MQSTASDRKRSGETVWVLVGLLACGFAVYGNALSNPFIIDDKIVILGDPRVADLDFRALLTSEYWPGEHGNRLYRPLTSLSFALNWALSQNAWTFRLPNLLIHISAAAALFLLTRELTSRSGAALVAALLFVVHPIHTTPLNQIVDRADLAAAAGVLFAAWLYVLDAGDSGRRCWYRPVTAAALFAVALLCKENAVTLAGVVALLDLARARAAAGGNLSAWLRRRICRCYLPMLTILLAYLAVRAAVLPEVARDVVAISPLDNIVAHPEYGLHPGDSRFLARWATPLALFAKAAGLLVWPVSLSWDYSYAAIDSVKRWNDTRVWVGLAGLLVVVGAMIASWRDRRQVFVAVGIALVTYGVVSNTVVPIGSVFAERYLYLPSAGFCMLVGVVAAAPLAGVTPKAPARKRGLSGAFLVAAAVGCAVCAVLTFERNEDFRASELLNAADLRAQPRSARLWCSVAADALNAEDFETALARAERAIAIFPEYVRAWRMAGLAHWRLRRLDQAWACLQRSCELGGADDEQALVALADILKSRGDYGAAISLLEAFATEHPRAPVAHNNLAWYLITAEPAGLRDPRRALPHSRQAIALEPAAGDFLDTHVAVLVALGRRDEAKRELREALPRIPADDPYRAALSRKLNEP